MSQPWMKFYPGDYLRDTRDLSPAEHGCYLLLIMHYWTTGGIPHDHERLARIVGADVTEWSTKWSTAVLSFFDEVDGEWRHGRIDEELAKAAEKRNKLIQSSRKGVEARTSGKPNGQPFGQPNGQPTPEPEPDTKEVAAGASLKAKKVSKSFLSDDWLPEGGVTDRQAVELSKMQDWAKSNAVRKADWQATWRNWLRKAGVPEGPPLLSLVPTRRRFYAAEGTEELAAWDAWWRKIHGINAPRDRSFGYEFDTQWPPAEEVSAL